jgi:hypothetical protein
MATTKPFPSNGCFCCLHNSGFQYTYHNIKYVHFSAVNEHCKVICTLLYISIKFNFMRPLCQREYFGRLLSMADYIKASNSVLSPTRSTEALSMGVECRS